MKLTNDIRKAVKSLLTSKPEPERREVHRHIIGRGRMHRKNIWCTPFKSDALGVNPEQIDEAEEAMRARGVPTEYDRRTGAAIVTGPAHYRKLAKASGLYNGRDGYGVPNSDGTYAGTGREAHRQKEELKQMIRDWAESPE